MNLCRHCQQKVVSRPRGLCWRCYYTPGLKEHYPSTSKFTRRGVSDFNGEAETPDTPTVAEPGSERKLCVLEKRASLGLSLHHPGDRLYQCHVVHTKTYRAVISVTPYLEDDPCN
mgnify:CR=1 FL=1